jgi:ketosteroid isomerase-like protein
MSAEDNKQIAKDAYAAFSKGDTDGAMAAIDDSVEWLVPGDNALSGTYRGKQEVGGLWGKIGEKGFQTAPSEFVADGDKVVVVTTYSIGGDQSRAVDLITYSGGKLVHFDAVGGEALFDRHFPK